MKKLHYEKSGDNYALKDPFKVLALKGAYKTRKNLKRFKNSELIISEITQSRGESAYRLSFSSKKAINFQIAHVEEGIGTKNIIADELAEKYGDKVYESVAIDNAASIFNDLSTTGASPLSFLLHIAAYPTEWFSQTSKMQAIINGTIKACNIAGASWGGGESPTMRDIIKTGKSLLSGSAMGIINPSKKALSEEKIKIGDRIVLLGSSGVHTNGITLLRKELVKRLPNGYETKLSDGSIYGETLLTPTIIYSHVVEELLKATDIHYATHITGHGWRKIMRSSRKLSYIVEEIPTPQPIFELIKNYTNSTNHDMYGSYNMGAGFVLYAPNFSVKTILSICKKYKISVINSGYIANGEKSLKINPLGLSFTAKDMVLR